MADVDRSRAPELGEVPEAGLPALERTRLGAGLEAVALARGGGPPVVVAEAIVRAGGANDPPGRAGLADLTARLLPEGAAGLGMLEIAERIEGLGASLSVGAGYDAAWLRLRVLRSNLDPALALLADLLRRPSFPTEEVERVLAERAVDLRRERDEPAVVAGLVFDEELYGRDHPYGLAARGTPGSIGRLARDAFLDFYRRAYGPSTTTVVVVGDVDGGRVADDVGSAFDGWSGGGRSGADVGPPTAPGTGTVLVDRGGSAQSELRVGHIGVARSHPDVVGLRVLDNLLGGSFHSRLNLNLRERRGWTYGIRSSFALRRGPGPFVVAASVGTPVTGPALEEIRAEIERAAAGPVERAERDLAVSALVRGLPSRFATPERVADRVREVVVHDLPDDHWVDYQERLRGVEVEDVERVAAAHLHPARLLAVVVGDVEEAGEGLAALGEVRRRAWKPAPADSPAGGGGGQRG